MAQNTQKTDALTSKAIAGQLPSSALRVAEEVRQYQEDIGDCVQKLQAKAPEASVSEKLKLNLRVKALQILVASLLNVCDCGEKFEGMPTDEEVQWAKKALALEQ